MKRTGLIALAIAATVLVALPAGAQSADEHESAITDGGQLALVYPVLSPDSYFTDSFGHARSGGRSHKGNDLIAERGTPIVAVADGRITRITKGTRAGFYMVVDHGDGYTSWYMHLNNDTEGTDDGRGGAATAFAPELTVGSPVAAGQVIAFLGDSGNAEETVPHLHFELRLNNIALDPYIEMIDAFERYLLEAEIEEGETPFK